MTLRASKRSRIRTRRTACALAAALALLCLAAAPASAQLLMGYHTQQLSQPLGGGKLNGASGGPTISHDKRIGSYAAYHSDADNIVAGDTNGHRDVFVVPRQGPWGIDGTPWEAGTTFIASKGLGGAPADGDSYSPSISGGSTYKPTCVAFASRATNLVPNDTNGVADIFVYYLHSGKIKRVSVAGKNVQANGPSSQPSVDKKCARVAFTSEATNLARGVQATPQVYVRFISGRPKKTTRVVSSTRSGAPGDGPSHEPDMTNWGTHVAFASRAGNLGAAGGTQQVYLKALPTLARKSAKQPIRIISRTPGGQPGDGDSGDPSTTYDGTVVAYETAAGNISHGGSLQHVVQTVSASGQSRTMSHGANGASFDPTMTDAAAWIFFASDSTNLHENDSRRPTGTGLNLWFRSTGGVWLKSDPTNRADAREPETSMHGNYLVFERSGAIWLEYLGDK